MSTPPSSPQAVWDDFRKRLHEFRIREQQVSVMQGALIWLSSVCLLSLLLVVIEAIFRFQSPARLILVGACGGLIIGLLLWRCLLPVIRPLNDTTLARRIESHFPNLHDRLTMALQLWRQREAHTPYISAALLDAALMATIGSTRTIDFSPAAESRRIQQASKILGAAILVFSLAWFLFFVPLSAAFNRLSHPLTEFPVPQKTFITVEPGDMELPPGSHLTVTAQLRGEIPDQATLTLYSDTRKPVRDIPLAKVGKSSFAHTLRNLDSSFIYRVGAGDATSQDYQVTIINRPTVTAVQMTYRYPEYTRLAARTTTDGTGDIVAIKGTRVTLEIEANQALSSARIVFDGEKRNIPMVVNERTATGIIHVLQDQSYQIELRNRDHAPNIEPAQYRISALPDRTPDVRIIAPGRNTDLTENMMLPLLIAATDDFGFSAMNLVFNIDVDEESQKKFISIDPDVTILSTPYVWDLSNIGLFPEDVVSYFIEVFDNDRITGPKRAVSQTFTVRFPSVVEIYEQIESNQAQQVTRLEEMLEEQREAKERVQALNREMTQKTQAGEQEDLSWEKKKDIESLISKQEQMAEDVLKAAEAMEEAIQQIEQHDMMNMELMEKMEQLRQLFQEIATPELLKAMQDIKKSMESLDQKKLAESMKDFEEAQEEFMKRLERSLSILKRMQAEQKMDSAVKQAQELLQRQEELQYATQNASQQSSEQTRQSLADKQSEIGQDTESMRQELENLANSMEELQGNLPSDQVRDVAESIQQQQMPQQMSRISQQLSSGQMNQASRGQRQMSQNLMRMSQQLQDAQAQMNANQKQEIAGEMRQAMHNLVSLSQGQESLQSRTAQPTGKDTRTQDLAEDQQSLLNGASKIADQLVETSQKSFFLSPQVGQSLGESLNRMQNARQGLAQQQRSLALQQQQQAMQALNQTVMALQQAMQNMMSASSASGMMEMLQQLQGMAQQQSGLNDELSQMMQQQGQGQNGQQMSMEERARMSRLASQQEAIRKSLEQLQREHQAQNQILGRLSEIEREMQESIQQLRQQQADPRLIERQQRILSRLLDASRSMRERDFEKRRESTPGENIVGRPSPDALSPSLLQRTQPIREDLLRGIENGTYPREYEELIRAYFRALSETPQN